MKYSTCSYCTTYSRIAIRIFKTYRIFYKSTKYFCLCNPDQVGSRIGNKYFLTLCFEIALKICNLMRCSCIYIICTFEDTLFIEMSTTVTVCYYPKCCCPICFVSPLFLSCNIQKQVVFNPPMTQLHLCLETIR